jgi:hypothetical protein
MEAIKKPGQRKQEMLNRFFWLRTFLVNPGRDLKLAPKIKTALIETVWNAQTAYMQADDDEYNFGVAVEAYLMLENGLMVAGVDVETEVSAIMLKNGYNNFNQLKPINKKLLDAIKRFEAPEPEPVFTGKGLDPWS